jgi:hypothetical protein
LHLHGWAYEADSRKDKPANTLLLLLLLLLLLRWLLLLLLLRVTLRNSCMTDSLLLSTLVVKPCCPCPSCYLNCCCHAPCSVMLCCC